MEKYTKSLLGLVVRYEKADVSYVCRGKHVSRLVQIRPRLVGLLFGSGFDAYKRALPNDLVQRAI
jgi:hypothetical protein